MSRRAILKPSRSRLSGAVLQRECTMREKLGTVGSISDGGYPG